MQGFVSNYYIFVRKHPMADTLCNAILFLQQRQNHPMAKRGYQYEIGGPQQEADIFKARDNIHALLKQTA